MNKKAEDPNAILQSFVNQVGKKETVEEKPSKDNPTAGYFKADREIKKVVNDHVSQTVKTIPNLDIAMYAACLNLYLRGLSQASICEHTGCAKRTLSVWVQQGWVDLREKLFTNITVDIFQQIQAEEVRHSKLLIKKLKPITNKLSARALIAADDKNLTAKDVLTQAREFIRLTGQFTGELVDNKNVSVGPNQIFTDVMEKINKTHVKEAEDAIPLELKEEPKLLG